jgi:hypothetical protein
MKETLDIILPALWIAAALIWHSGTNSKESRGLWLLIAVILTAVRMVL